MKVCTRQYGGGDISRRMTFQGAKVRTPLLAVSEVIDKANMVVFDGTDWFLHIARYMCWRQLCEKGRCRCPGAAPTQCEKWSVRSYTRGRGSVGRERLERAKHQAEQAWTTLSVAETRLVAAREARNASGREWMM